MALLQHSDVYWEFAGQCTQCGHCTKACSSLTMAEMTLGDIAHALLDAEREAEDAGELAALIYADPLLTQAVRGCFFCTSCKNTCFAHNDVEKLIYSARVDFQKLGLIPRDTWSSVLVDEQWHIFSAYRAIHGIGYSDLTRHIATEQHEAAMDCEVAFFPGCAMAAYGPELTREVFAKVEELGGKTTMLDSCCGSSLKSAGFYERAEALCDRNADEIAASGAKQLVCVCPGCANAMKVALARKGVEAQTVSLSAFLADHGFEAPAQAAELAAAGSLCLAKSCQDRDGRYLEETMAALNIDGTLPTIFHGCCGAGGAVSAFQPERQTQQATEKLDFAAPGSTVVSMCPTCTYTYAYLLRNAELTGEPRDITSKHYTELLFDAEFDWDLVFAQLEGMWYGEYGAWLAQVFA